MPGLFAVAFAMALAMGAQTPPPDDGNTVSPVDVPGAGYRGVEVVRPDRDPAHVVCRYESQPDTRFKKRSCAHRRDREALETIEHQHMMTYQRAFCVAGEGC